MAAGPAAKEPKLAAPDGFIKISDSLSPGAVPHGNFRHYYTFNEAGDRTKHLPTNLLLKCSQQNDNQGKPLLMLDIGCNTGELTSSLLSHWHANELKQRPFYALGLDIDPSLIERGQRKYSHLGDRLELDAVNVAHAEQTKERLEAFLNKHGREKFDLITLFSVTMWLHVHNGDDGLKRILQQLASYTDAMLLEPQIPKCYKSAKRRMTRAGVALPPYLESVELKGDQLLPAIQRMVKEDCQLPHVVEIGDTHWDRTLTLYTRQPVAL
eukprot:TRINITY_DN9231_c0_g1_i1.p2 TRINITY_DN9231_c0_g1~~TRINITY_DN9231_c0_g1_i1.p2  ORF type:complete len:268 (+),score=49.85 TRINITY_DN9231_c0_g1_i1:2489-3292(+)